MRRMKKLTAICLFWLVICAASGCSAGEDGTASLKDGEYYTYYVNASGTALVSRVYETSATDTEELIDELLDQCRQVPENSDGRRALPLNVIMSRDPVLENGILSLYFDMTYSLMDNVTEVLCRAALAKTLTQLEDVSYITLYVNDLPLAASQSVSEDGGNVVGGGVVTAMGPVLLTGDDFIDNDGDDTSHYSQSELLLYFADESGTALKTEKRTVVYSNNVPLERVIVNQLIEGPQTEELTATLSPELKLREIGVRDSVCYVDFDSSFLEDPTNVVDAVQIYSIVNSLTELASVSSVQITINGSSDELFRNNISLSELFERNLDYMAGE